MLGLGAVGVAVGSKLQDVESSATRKLGPGVQDLIPIGGGWRYYSVTDTVHFRTPADYTLKVSGRVKRPRTLTFAELEAMPQTQISKDFQCVTGWRIPKVAWSGVAMPDFLEAVGADLSAPALRLTSFDGSYTESLTMAQARRRDILVATSMLGKPITNDHGGPVRLYVGPMYGYKSLKWLGGIEVVDKVTPGYWEVRGYDVDAWVGKSNGRDDVPT